MKHALRNILSTVLLFSLPTLIFCQAPDLGTAADFVLFSTDGAVSNTSTTHLTGKVGTNNGSNTGFGNVNGGMHAGDGVTAQAAADLLLAYGELADAIPDFTPASSLGGGQTLNAGVYAISGAATIDGEVKLNAQNNANAVFIFQISGPLSTTANSKVTLINGAQACNVFWKVEGLVDMATGTTMRGTIIANNAGINMSSGDTLEGRALSTAGAITIDGVLAYTPIGCGSISLTGPTAPSFGEAGCYGLFTSDGPLENSGITNIVGDVGCNVGLTTGFNPLTVTGSIHPIPDISTANAAADLLGAYNYLNELAEDIELIYPAQFGGNLVLTPHTYILNGATTFTDTLYLNAQDNADAVFVIKIFGALETTANSNVVLMNDAQAKNVYWLVNGAVDVATNSIFNGTIVSQGAINLHSGVHINGRALSGVGALSTSAIDGAADIELGNCDFSLSIDAAVEMGTASIYPNPFADHTTLVLNNIDPILRVELTLYNLIGKEMMRRNITSPSTMIDLGMLTSGIYLYTLTGNDKMIQSGKLISQ